MPEHVVDYTAYYNAAQRDHNIDVDRYKRERHEYISRATNGLDPGPYPRPVRDFVSIAKDAATTEKNCNERTKGPLHDAENGDCCRLNKLKVFITLLKFALSIAAIVLFSKLQVGFPRTTIAAYILLAVNLLRFFYIIYLVFTIFTAFNIGMELCCNTICRTCCEISYECTCCVCCCCKNPNSSHEWQVQQSNMIFYMVYYAASILLFIIFGGLIAGIETFQNGNTVGVVCFFLVFILHVISFIIELIRYFKLKTRQTRVHPFHN